MKTVYVACLAILAAGGLAPCCGRAAQSDDEAAIRKQDQAYVAAYNSRDAKALAGLWAPDAVYTDPSTGAAAEGRDEIEKMFAESFTDVEDAVLDLSVTSIDFVSPSVAIETGVARLIRPSATPDETRYSAVFVRRDGQWLLDRVNEETPPEPPPSNYEHLKDLEWMIGSWVDLNDDAIVQTDCQWAKNKNFMHRSFAVVIGDQVKMAGMQIVGWDPMAKQIRSWVFDSDGGFAEGRWTQKGDAWSIQQTGVLADGRKSSATNVIKKIDDNSFWWKSVNREMDGDVLPNLDEVMIVRRPDNLSTPVDAGDPKPKVQVNAAQVTP